MEAVAAEDKAKLQKKHNLYWVLVLSQKSIFCEDGKKAILVRRKKRETEVKLAFDKRHQKWACKTFIISHD